MTPNSEAPDTPNSGTATPNMGRRVRRLTDAAATPKETRRALTKRGHLMAGQDLMDGRCQATAKSTGERCRQPAIPGGWICSDHGVNKAVRAKAEARIAALVTPALRTIAALLDPRRRWDHPTVALRAAEDALELNDMWPGKGTKKAGGLSLPSLPAGTTSATFTASVKVETLTDAEIETMKQILEKMGAGLALKTIDVDPVPQP